MRDLLPAGSPDKRPNRRQSYDEWRTIQLASRSPELTDVAVAYQTVCRLGITRHGIDADANASRFSIGIALIFCIDACSATPFR
jgi:hypothetical protein